MGYEPGLGHAKGDLVFGEGDGRAEHRVSVRHESSRSPH